LDGTGPVLAAGPVVTGSVVMFGSMGEGSTSLVVEDSMLVSASVVVDDSLLVVSTSVVVEDSMLVSGSVVLDVSVLVVSTSGVVEVSVLVVSLVAGGSVVVVVGAVSVVGAAGPRPGRVVVVVVVAAAGLDVVVVAGGLHVVVLDVGPVDWVVAGWRAARPVRLTGVTVEWVACSVVAADVGGGSVVVVLVWAGWGVDDDVVLQEITMGKRSSVPSLAPAVSAIMVMMLTSTRNTPALPAMTLSRLRHHGGDGVTCSIRYVHPSSGGVQSSPSVNSCVTSADGLLSRSCSREDCQRRGRRGRRRGRKALRLAALAAQPPTTPSHRTTASRRSRSARVASGSRYGIGLSMTNSHSHQPRRTIAANITRTPSSRANVAVACLQA
jgi:hypothetical protein